MKSYVVFFTDSTGEKDECAVEVSAESADAARALVESWGEEVSAVI